MSEQTEEFRQRIANVRKTGNRDDEMFIRDLLVDVAIAGPYKAVLAMAEACLAVGEADDMLNSNVPIHADEDPARGN